MSFIHRLSQTTAQAQRDEAERKRLYDLETERLAQALAARAKEEFMEECEEAAKKGQNQCCIRVGLSEEVRKRNGGKDITEQKLRAMLVELGFHGGKVDRVQVRVWRSKAKVFEPHFDLTATWPVADATSSKEPSPERAGGTSITCPICHEHRPAVVLTPCGHVVCRDCQRCQQLRQCPMCRRPISSASDGLFMD